MTALRIEPKRRAEIFPALLRRCARGALFLCAWTLGVSLSASAAVQLPTNFVAKKVVTGLNQPNGMAFLPDGRVLITEQRTAKVRMVVNGHIASSDPVLVVPDVNPQGLERGLQGIAVDPAWPARPYVYLFHNRPGSKIRVVRYTASGDLDDAMGESLALNTPLILLDDLPDASHLHNGGGLRFGPYRHLFVSLGEDEDRCAATDSTSLRGQILRLKVDELPAGGGTATREMITPAFNPLATADSNAKLVWAYGLRNPWRFHVDPATALVYTADVGESDFEEYNEIQPGDHLGWPFREGEKVMMPPFLCLEPGGAGASPYKSPIATYPHPKGLAAIFSAGVYRAPAGGADNWPAEYEGNVFFGDYYHGFMRRLVRQGNQWIPAPEVEGQPNATDWAAGLKSAVDFLVGRDGSLWWLRQFDDTFQGVTGALERIRYIGHLVDAGARSVPTRTLSAAPVPFSSHVELTFARASAGPVTLSVYDLFGRRVRLLLNGRIAEGTNRVAWDGRDQSGRDLPPGLYLARLEQQGLVEMARVLKLR